MRHFIVFGLPWPGPSHMLVHAETRASAKEWSCITWFRTNRGLRNEEGERITVLVCTVCAREYTRTRK